jgi:hypothetical protein
MLTALSTTLTLFSLLGSEADVEPSRCAADEKSTASLQTVAVRPIRADVKSANAVLEVGFAAPSKHRALVISFAGKRLVAKDDGVYPDRTVGDGIFAVAATLKEKPGTTRQSSFTDGEGDVVLFDWKIKFKITACPPDCESLLGGSCWFCIGVAEVEVGS